MEPEVSMETEELQELSSSGLGSEPELEPPPRYQWKRPCLQRFGGRVNLYVRNSIIPEIKLVMITTGGDELLDRFREGPFGRLLGIRRNDSSNNALHEFLAHELYDKSLPKHERWFHVGGTNIAFSAQDFALITGPVFGKGGGFNPNEPIQIPSRDIYYRFFKGRKTKVSELRTHFKGYNLGKDGEDYVNAGNILFVYLMLVCRDYIIIEDWVWALVEDTDQWERFPWGAYSFLIMCHYISLLPQHPSQINKAKKYHVYGPVWVFNIWMYEIIPYLGSMCGTRDEDQQRPCCLEW